MERDAGDERHTDTVAAEEPAILDTKVSVTQLSDRNLASASVPRPSPTPAPQVQRGQAIGRFLLLDQLGAGGMGVVNAAFDPDLDRKVAIKVRRAGRAPTGC